MTKDIKNSNSIQEYLYILSHSDGEIYEIELTDRDENLNVETILAKRELFIEECDYMWTTRKIKSITPL